MTVTPQHTAASAQQTLGVPGILVEHLTANQHHTTQGQHTTATWGSAHNHNLDPSHARVQHTAAQLSLHANHQAPLSTASTLSTSVART
jgi:hypothetical protein